MLKGGVFEVILDGQPRIVRKPKKKKKKAKRARTCNVGGRGCPLRRSVRTVHTSEFVKAFQTALSSNKRFQKITVVESLGPNSVYDRGSGLNYRPRRLAFSGGSVVLGEADEATVEAAAAGTHTIVGARSGREIPLGFELLWIQSCLSLAVAHTLPAFSLVSGDETRAPVVSFRLMFWLRHQDLPS